MSRLLLLVKSCTWRKIMNWFITSLKWCNPLCADDEKEDNAGQPILFNTVYLQGSWSWYFVWKLSAAINSYMLSDRTKSDIIKSYVQWDMIVLFLIWLLNINKWVFSPFKLELSWHCSLEECVSMPYPYRTVLAHLIFHKLSWTNF